MLAFVVLVAAYLNYWMWDDGRIVLGFPVNMLYHIVLSVVASATMLVLVRRAWPDDLGKS